MKKVTVKNKTEIKDLLNDGHILGIKDGQYSSFGGFQIWWYDRKLDVCHSCESHWVDRRKKVESYKPKKAAKVLWHNHNSLYLYTKHMSEEKRFQVLNDLVGKIQ